MPRWQFELFNFFFIVIWQNIILLLIALPAFTAYQHRSTQFGVWDLVIAVVFFAFTVGETVADQQQWNFQNWKKAEKAAGRDPHPQFVQTGLWRFSRHPNFFFEQAQWWTLFFFGVVAAGSLLQWTVVGRLPAHDAVHRLDDLHREHHEVPVPGVRGLPGAGLADHPVPAASRRRPRDRELI